MISFRNLVNFQLRNVYIAVGKSRSTVGLPDLPDLFWRNLGIALPDLPDLFSRKLGGACLTCLTDLPD